jgi:hypothetical protein
MSSRLRHTISPTTTPDARNALVHGEGWTEWELVKRAVPRFAGHDQPKVPAWGCTDEADPAQMAQKIDALSRDLIQFRRRND